MKVLFAAALTAAAVAVTSAAEFCDQWGQAKSGNYIIYNNLWGSSAANPGGKQCTALDSASGDSVAWHTTWSWQGGDKSVKSFANAALEFEPVPLSEVKSIPSTMAYSVKSKGKGKTVADVAYDLFTSSTAKGEKEFEIMIWLAALGGAGAISSTGKPIASTTIAGTEWSVYKGPNGSMMVYSFVASKQVENFEGDLLEFFNYLVKEQGFKTSQFLIKVECGTEPFVGTDVTMTVSKYSAAVNTSGGSSTPTQSGESSSSTEQTTTAPAASNTGSSAEQTTPAPAESNTGSSAEQTTPAPAGSNTGSSAEQSTPAPAESNAGSSEEQTPSTGSSTEQTTDAPAASNTGSSEETPSTGSSEETPSTGSSEETPATSNTGSSWETPATSDAGSSEETPATSTTGSSAETPATGSSEETPSTGSSEETPATSTTGSSAETPATGSSEETPVESSTGSSEQNPGQQEPSTPTTSSSSEETPSTETNPKCVLRRVRRE